MEPSETSSSQDVLSAGTEQEGKPSRVEQAVEDINKAEDKPLEAVPGVQDSNKKPIVAEFGEREQTIIREASTPEEYSHENYEALFERSGFFDNEATKAKERAELIKNNPIAGYLRTMLRATSEGTIKNNKDLKNLANIALDEAGKPQKIQKHAEYLSLIGHQEALTNRMKLLMEEFKDVAPEEGDVNAIAFNKAYTKFQENKIALSGMDDKFPLATFLDGIGEKEQLEYDNFYKKLSPLGKVITNGTMLLKGIKKNLGEDLGEFFIGASALASPELAEAYFKGKSHESFETAKSTSRQQRPIREKVFEFDGHKIGVSNGKIVAIYDKDGYKTQMSYEDQLVLIDKIEKQGIDLNAIEKTIIGSSLLWNVAKITGDIATTRLYVGAGGLSKALKSMGAQKSLIPLMGYQYGNDFMREAVEAEMHAGVGFGYSIFKGLMSGAVESIVPIEAGINRIPLLKKRLTKLNVAQIGNKLGIEGGIAAAKKNMLTVFQELKDSGTAIFAEGIEEVVDDGLSVGVDAIVNASFDEIEFDLNYDPLETYMLGSFASVAPVAFNTLSNINQLGSTLEFRQALLAATTNVDKYQELVADIYKDDNDSAMKAISAVSDIVNGHEDFFEASSVPDGQKMDFAHNQLFLNKAEEVAFEGPEKDKAKNENAAIITAYQLGESTKIEKLHKSKGTYVEQQEEQTTTPKSTEETTPKEASEQKDVKESISDDVVTKPNEEIEVAIKPKTSLEDAGINEEEAVNQLENPSPVKNETEIIRRAPNSVETDEDRFQPRQLDGSKEKGLDMNHVKEIANDFQDIKQNAVIFWYDPVKKKDFVLSGHHTREAAEMAGRETIKFQEFKGTEAEAIKFAEFSNQGALQQSALQNAQSLRKLRLKGDKEGAKKFLTSQNKNKNLVESLSHLDSDGPVVELLVRLNKGTDTEQQNNVNVIADYIGTVKKKFKNKITLDHEQEMLSYLLKNKKNFNKKDQFVQKIADRVGGLDYDKTLPLNLNEVITKSDQERQFDRINDDFKKQIGALQDEAKAINNRFKNPNDKQYIDPDDPEYEAIKKQADNKIAEISANTKALQIKHLEHIKSKGSYIDAQKRAPTLFSQLIEPSKEQKPVPETEDNTKTKVKQEDPSDSKPLEENIAESKTDDTSHESKDTSEDTNAPENSKQIKEWEANQKKEAEEGLIKIKEQIKEDLGQIDLHQMSMLPKGIETALNKAVSYLFRIGKKTFKDFINWLGTKPSLNLFNLWSNQKKVQQQSTFDIHQQLNFRDSFVEFFSDRNHALDIVVNQLNKNNPLGDGFQTYMKQELWKSKSVQATKLMMEKIIGREKYKLGGEKVTAESLRGRLEAAGLNWDAFSDFLYSLHAKERNQRVREIHTARRDSKIAELTEGLKKGGTDYNNVVTDLLANYEIPERGSGMFDSEADAIQSKLRQEGTYDQYLEFATEFKNTVIQGRIEALKEGSIISEELGTQMENGEREGFTKFDWYLPLMVKKEHLPDDDYGLQSDGPNGSQIKGIIGTDKFTRNERYDPIIMSLIMYGQAVRAAEKNKALVEFAELINANPDPAWNIVKARGSTVQNEIGEVVSSTDLTPQRVKDNSIAFKINGKTRYLFFLPVDGRTHPIIQALGKSNYDSKKWLETVKNTLRLFNGYMRAVITTINPAFAVANVTKDFQDALTNVGLFTEDMKDVRKLIAANTIDAIEVLAYSPYGEIKDTKLYKVGPNAKRLHKNWLLAQKHGVPMSWRNHEGVDVEMEKMAQEIQDIQNFKPSDIAKGLFERAAYLSDTLENVMRLSVFDALIQKGLDPDTAAFAAKNASVNFEKKGTGGEVINTLWLFANAAIQGNSLTLQAVKNSKILKFLGLVTALSAANKMLLMALMDDEEYDKLINDDRITSQNTLFFNPFDVNNPIKLPKPYSGIRIAQTLGESIVDVATGKKTVFNRTLNILTQSITIVDPIGGSGQGLGAAAPTIVQPLVQSALNKSWANENIRYYHEQDKPDAFQYNRSTIGKENIFGMKYTDMVQGVWKASRGNIDVSATSLEYVTGQYFPGVLKEFGKIPNILDAETITDVPFIGGMVKRFYHPVADKDKNEIYTVINMSERPFEQRYTKEEVKYLYSALPRIQKLVSPATLKKIVKQIRDRNQEFGHKALKLEQEFKQYEKKVLR